MIFYVKKSCAQVFEKEQRSCLLLLENTTNQSAKKSFGYWKGFFTFR